MTAAVDRTRPPAGGAPRGHRLPAFARDRLANGLEVLLAPSRAIPTVELTLLLPAGAERNPLERPGLASLTAALVDEGTRRRSGPEIADDVERLGASLTTHADWNAAELEIEMLAADAAAGIDLLAEIAREALFPEAEVERLRRQAMTELLRRRDQPAVLAEEALARTLYAGTPYAALLLGSEASLAALSRAEIAAFHSGLYRPAGAALLVGGDFDPEEMRQRVERIFGDWDGSTPAAAPPIRPAPRAGRTVIVVDRPHAAQTELRIGHVGAPRAHPDRTRLQLLNTLLGGKFTSRINLNLRERNGFTYGASSRFVERRGPGPFVVSAAVATAVTGAATREALAELERIRSEPVTPAELTETRDYLIGVFPYTLQTIGGRLARLEELALYGLPDDHFDRALEEIARLGPDDVLAAAREHVRPQEAVIVAVGPAAELRGQLEPFGPVTVVGPSGEGAG